MGKASSSKKVARAAKAGGRLSSGQPRGLLFPSVLALVFILGLSLVVYARADRRADDLAGPQLGDHIHQAFGVHVCGRWLPDLPEFESRVGIHTHADGVIHVHPYSQLGAGANATLGKFFAEARTAELEVSIDDSRVEWMGEVVEEGVTECEGVSDPQLRVAYWDWVQDPAATPRVTTAEFTDLRLDTDGAGITIFYGDPGDEIPRPPTADRLFELGAVDGRGQAQGAGEDPAAEPPAGGPAGQDPTGEDPAGEDPAGQDPAGQGGAEGGDDGAP